MEIDQVALQREARSILAYIESASPEEEALYSYNVKLRPLLEASIQGNLEVPNTTEPYNLRLIMEGLEPDLPIGLEEMYFQFMCRIQGSPSLSSASIKQFGHYVPGAAEEIVNGIRFEWVNFEG